MSLSSATGLGATRLRPQGATGHGRDGSLFHSPGTMLLLGVVLGICLCWQHIAAVWQTGRFFDTDDAMHMVQVRDWMGGQGWFDMTATRMDPPHGVAMHWTRVTDIPIALLDRFFALFLAPQTAERAMRIAWGVLLLAAFFAIVVSLARKLVGMRSLGAAVILAATCATVVSQLAPGRLSHQNVQVVLMMALLRALLDVFEPRRRAAWVAVGVLCALSLSISLEDLPFVAVAMAVVCGAWIVRGPAMAGALAWIGGSFALAAPAAFVATTPPARWTLEACDAFSAAHLIAAAVGGLGFLVLACATRMLAGPGRRVIAAAIVGAAVVGAVSLTFPGCLGDPFGAVDPVVRRAWLHNVSESQPLGALLYRHFLDHLPLAAPLFIGLACLCAAVVRERGEARLRWIALAAFAAMAVAGAFWQVRLASYGACVTLFGGVWLFTRLSSNAPWSPRLRPILASLAMLPFSGAAWVLAVPSAAESEHPLGDPEACLTAAAFAPLEALPKGSILFAGIDPGPFILAYTDHATVTGPYHRDNRGLRLTVDAMQGDAETARARIASSGATHVAVCPASTELATYVDDAPNGFAAQLRKGAAPAWLQPMEVKSTPYRVYRVAK